MTPAGLLGLKNYLTNHPVNAIVKWFVFALVVVSVSVEEALLLLHHLIIQSIAQSGLPAST